MYLPDLPLPKFTDVAYEQELFCHDLIVSRLESPSVLVSSQPVPSTSAFGTCLLIEVIKILLVEEADAKVDNWKVACVPEFNIIFTQVAAYSLHSKIDVTIVYVLVKFS